MTRYSFMDDYSEGCHPAILSALSDTNMSQQIAYGDDDYSHAARLLILEYLGGVPSEVHFVAGGTLANLTVIAAILRPHEAVISANTGHIISREAGAIEAVGHKILTVETPDGKLSPEDILQTLTENAHAPHMVKPRMVYISNATETGRVYTKAELEALSHTCRKNDLYLFLDGARLGAALTSTKSDVSLADLAKLTDLFWIGGTKAGALIGEAIVINNLELTKDFAFHVKQRGALLAKGRLLGLQFKTLFETDLFFTAGITANTWASQISQAIVEAGHKLDSLTETNMIFPIFPNDLIAELEKDFRFYKWRPYDENRSVLRLVTSWATDRREVENLISAVQN